MGLDQKEPTVFYVKQGNSDQWDVCEEGFDKPIASFSQMEDANKYAQDLANAKPGARVKND